MNKAQAHEPQNRPWTSFCDMWRWVTDEFARFTLAAPLPPTSGYYWVRLIGRPEWSVAEYAGKDEWYTFGSDYYNSTVEEGIVEWRGPLEPPND